MEYLVLQRFRSMGVTHHKGTIVDESLIRSPHLRVAEGKIIKGVSSLEVPVEVAVQETEEQPSTGISNGVTIEEEEIEEAETKELKKPLLSFK